MHSDAENQPPADRNIQGPVVAATKEAILGRRAYAKCIDGAFQETYASTADRTRRDALSRVAEAWSALDETDPEGELLLLKAIFERVQADPKLAAQIMPQRVANAQLASLRLAHGPSPRKAAIVAERELPGSRDPTPSSSPQKLQSRDGTPRLVMAPQNPHLRSLRKKQSLLQLDEKKEQDRKGDDKLPGKVEQGMEHVGLLADVLYGRWTEGLKSRWPLA